MATEVVLKRRPNPSEPVSTDMMEVRDVPVDPVGPSDIRVRPLFLSVDPFLRCRFDDDTGVDYTAPYAIDGPISSAGIAVVEEVGDLAKSRGDYLVGGIVLDPFDSMPWKSSVTFKDVDTHPSLTPLSSAAALVLPLTATLGAVGQTGLTAFCGVTYDHRVGPADTVVVSGAAGAVGVLVGQLAKARGATVIGIAGSQAKVDRLLELGFDAGVCYKDPDFTDALEAACPRKATLYWDNVGGSVTDAVVDRAMVDGSHILLCGQVSRYNEDEEYPPPLPPPTQAIADQRSISRRRYLVLDYQDRFDDALRTLGGLVAGGRLVAPETLTAGSVADAPAAFVDMMGGGNFGKALVSTSPAPATVRAFDALRENVLPGPLKAWLAGMLM